MASTSTFTYNDGLYVPWTSPASNTPAPAMTTAPAASATPRWSPTTTEDVDHTTTQAFVEQSTAAAATTTQWQAQTTSAAAVVPTTQAPATSAEATTPPPASEAAATITTTPLSTSKGTISRSIMVVGTPMATATATIGAASQDSSSTTHEAGFKKIYLILLLLLVPLIIIATIVIIRRRRRQRRHARGDPYDEEGGLVVGGKFVGDDDYSEKSSIATVQRRSSKWSFIRQSWGRGSRRRDDAMSEISEISEGPSLPFRAVSYSSVHGGGNGGPEDRPFQPPMEDRAIDFNRFFNTLPRVDERDIESGNLPNGRWEAPSGLGAAAGTALDAGKRMLGGWGWSSKSRRLELVSPRLDGSTNTRSSMRIPSPSIYSPNPDQSGPYAGLQGIDEDDHVDLDAYLGESRVGDSSLASRYLDDPESVPVKEDYRLPLSPKGPKPMPRPGMVVVDLPAAPSRTFMSPTKKSGILPATDPGTPPPNAGLLFKYDSPSATPVRHSIPTPSSPRPPLPTPPTTSTRTFPEPHAFHSKAVNLGVVYDPPVAHNFKPLAPATHRAHGSPRQLPKKPSRDLFAQAMPEPEPIVVTSGTMRVRKKQPLPEITSSPIIEFGDSSTLEPLRHPSKVKNAIYDLEKRTKETTTMMMMTSPTKVDLMGHHSPARTLTSAAPSLTQASVGKLLLARRTEVPLAESAIADDHDNDDDDDDASVYSVDESVIAERPVYQSNSARVMPTLAGARYTRPAVDPKPLSSDPKRLSAMLRRPSLPQLKE
ncbi:BZ3500_MvSof-1268-A1-R1_Chr1-3g02523 [Microbotryum saponariae]|uniref:BZ3500_MvSof-1268-A1-R1_Chr1-3g02523 protein n=1 Tax=Microbotryum saponariae TaxID=289078 RepID=A0A2X0MAC6_9BASI|nr:BZ3500_MvSof-1268-A1-R1_Chr1-3g02523 [Microbotryum saponariae]SCZ96478.1 BZ3501_MvSof-1269-A2-R1_Chr1-3g02126 [Microbotryum saponariae]